MLGSRRIYDVRSQMKDSTVLKTILALVSLTAIHLTAHAQEAKTPEAATTAQATSEESAATAGNGGAYIRITDANFKKSLLGLPPFRYQGVEAATPQFLKAGKELFDVFRNDMEVSGYFNLVKTDAMPDDIAKSGLEPEAKSPSGFSYGFWKQLKTDFLIRVGYHIYGGDVHVTAYVYYVPQEKTILAKTYKTRVADVRAAAHTFANDVIKELTGKPGMFLSRIVASRSTRKDQKEIFVMDWDGANSRQITSHKSIAQSPAWSYDGRLLVYSVFAFHSNEKKRNLDLFSYNITTGRRFLLSYRRGVNSGATFFPDNRNIMLTISAAGNPDLYKMALDGSNPIQITNGPRSAMNVEPAVSPDGKRIAFSSDRSGRPHLFVMNVDGSGARQITIAGDYNSAPRWSPDSKRLVFAGNDKGHFDIFTVGADGSDMVRLTSAKKPGGRWADNEDPSYSPDGRHILFVSNRTGANQLYITNLDGDTERRITFDAHRYFRPHWSPSFD